MDLREKLRQVESKPASTVNAHAVATIARQVLGNAQNLKERSTNEECLRELDNIIMELQKTPYLLESFNESTDTEFKSFDFRRYSDLSRHVYNCLDSLICIKKEYHL